MTASAGLASLGFQILGVDSDQDIVRRLQGGDCIFPEPSLPELLASHRARMAFTTDFAELAACDVVIFGQDTFITDENEMDLGRIHSLIDGMIPHFRQDATILFMSQVPVGFTRALLKNIRDQRGNVPFRLHYWVDVLVVGDAVSRFLKPGRIIIGHEQTPEGLAEPVSRMFQSFHCPILDMNYESAEITKSAVNVYLATTVTFANALSNLCEAVGADMTQIIPALRLDKRIGPFAYIKPGLGFSGGHLERDLVALSRLARSHGVDTSVLDLIQEESAGRYQWLTQHIESEIFAQRPSPTIALWGLSYKKNTDSTHGAPSLKVIRDCAKRARLVAYDPLVRLPSDLGVKTVEDRYAALEGAAGLLILSDWDEFKTLDVRRLKEAMETAVVIDPLGVLADIDFTHARMCRTSRWDERAYDMTQQMLGDRVAIITGGSKGIGREIALSYARAGCRIVLVARDEKELRETAAFIQEETGAEALFFAVDITQKAPLEAMVHAVTTRFQRIDILVNAAAIVGPIGPFETCDEAEWEKTISVNVLGTYVATRSVVPAMIARRWGTIINFAGGGAFGARERFSAYSVSKAAVVRLTDAAAKELGDHGITVNGISPGQVNTEMFETMVAAGREKVGEAGWVEFEQRKQTGGDPIGEVARFALFLTSEEGRKITGRVMSVQWDPWEHFPRYVDELMTSDIYTMRRITPKDHGKTWT